jgi:putative membrane protein
MQDTTTTNGCVDSNLWKGLAAGLVGGLVASWTMNRFQDVWSNLARTLETRPGNQFQKVSPDYAQGDEEVPGTQGSELGEKQEAQDDTTVRAASAVSEGLFDHKLTPSEKKFAGTAVHYLLGTGVGGLYGAAAEIAPNATAGAGLPFGAVFWLVVDEGAVPLLGLSEGPMAYPLSTHAYALSSHFVYGLTAEVVRRAVRSAL